MRRSSPRPIHGEVVFDSVSFAYQGGKPVLRGVSFRARAGSVNVIRGPSGSGKSTIGALIAGLYLPSRGRVLIVVERGISGLTRGRTLFLIIHHDSAVAPVDQTLTIGRGRVRPESGLAVGPVRSAHHQEASCPASGAVSPLAGEAVGGAAAG